MKGRHSLTGGFTLIEVLIVATVIGVVASVAIPGFQNAKKAANESGVIANLKGLVTSVEAYRLRLGAYPTQMQDLADAQIVDEVIGGSTAAPGKSGYLYTLTAVSGTWNITADPITPGITGNRYFYIDASGVVHYSESGTASASDPPVDP